ncbi:MAG: hypothetical protein CMJ78_22440 [Planctomycetaceae bacterium]|nr:hypothetical protein [Planctomycetaceae bacterium]
MIKTSWRNTTYGKALESDPESISIRTELGIVLAKQKKWEAAKRLLEATIAEEDNARPGYN